MVREGSCLQTGAGRGEQRQQGEKDQVLAEMQTLASLGLELILGVTPGTQVVIRGLEGWTACSGGKRGGQDGERPPLCPSPLSPGSLSYPPTYPLPICRRG